MRIVFGAAGMGNMMFQYAFRCALQKHYGDRCAFILLHRYIGHNGYELRRVFNIDKNEGLTWCERLYVRVFEWLNRHYVPKRMLLWRRPHIDMGVFQYNSDVWSKPNRNLYYEGVCQTERMFAPPYGL